MVYIKLEINSVNKMNYFYLQSFYCKNGQSLRCLQRAFKDIMWSPGISGISYETLTTYILPIVVATMEIEKNLDIFTDPDP